MWFSGFLFGTVNLLGAKMAGRVPPDAFLFVSQQKGSKKWLLLRRASLSPIYYGSTLGGCVDRHGDLLHRGRGPYLLLGPQGLNGEFYSSAPITYHSAHPTGCPATNRAPAFRS